MAFVQEFETAYNSNTSPKTTAAFDVLAGDILVGMAVIADNDASVASSKAGPTLTWTQQEVTPNVGFAPLAALWTTPITADATGMTVTFTRSGINAHYGGNVTTWRSVDGVGDAVQAMSSSGAPLANIVTERPGSTIVTAIADISTADGSTRVWRTGAGALTELAYTTTAQYTMYMGYHAAAGSAGTYGIGLTAPTGQDYAMVAVEILPILPSEPGGFMYTMGQR